MSKYVIIGNSVAAVGAIEGIRKIDRDGYIIVFAAEGRHVYSRPLISYLLRGDVSIDKMPYRDTDFYQKNNVTFVDKPVTSLDTSLRTVTYAGGSILYDKLLLATGSTPFVPPMSGLKKSAYHSFYTLDDALALDEAIHKIPRARVLIVGAGLIGLKCAEGILDRVGSVEVVDLAPRILSSILDEGTARIIQAHFEAQRVTFRLSDSVDHFEKKHALMKSGAKIDFDILVMAVGVRPNSELMGVQGGYEIDSRCQTSKPDIYAAGDCAKGYCVTSNDKRVLALLPNAYRQGECAGINMAGGNYELRDMIPMNAIGFFGKHIVTAGTYVGQEKEVVSETTFKKFFIENNLLKGFIIIGDVARSGIYTALVREQIPLDTLDFDALAVNPGLIAFSPEYRNSKLNMVV